jgi:hypothetical protein
VRRQSETWDEVSKTKGGACHPGEHTRTASLSGSALQNHRSAESHEAARQRHEVIRPMKAGRLASQPGCFVEFTGKKILMKCRASGKGRGAKGDGQVADRYDPQTVPTLLRSSRREHLKLSDGTLEGIKE